MSRRTASAEIHCSAARGRAKTPLPRSTLASRESPGCVRAPWGRLTPRSSGTRVLRTFGSGHRCRVLPHPPSDYTAPRQTTAPWGRLIRLCSATPWRRGRDSWRKSAPGLSVDQERISASPCISLAEIPERSVRRVSATTGSGDRRTPAEVSIPLHSRPTAARCRRQLALRLRGKMVTGNGFCRAGC